MCVIVESSKFSSSQSDIQSRPDRDLSLNPSRLLQVSNIYTWQWPLGSERCNLRLQLLYLHETLFPFLVNGGHANEVLQHLGSRFLLQKQGELDGAMEEIGDDLHLGFSHISGGKCRCTETDTTWDLSRGVAGDSVF